MINESICFILASHIFKIKSFAQGGVTPQSKRRIARLCLARSELGKIVDAVEEIPN